MSSSRIKAEKIRETPEHFYLAPDDVFVVSAWNYLSNTANTKHISVENAFNNNQVDWVVSNTKTLSTHNFIIRRNETPVSSTEDIVEGTWFFDENFIYVAVANNIIKRVALSSF